MTSLASGAAGFTRKVAGDRRIENPGPMPACSYDLGRAGLGHVIADHLDHRVFLEARREVGGHRLGGADLDEMSPSWCRASSGTRDHAEMQPDLRRVAGALALE